MARSWPDSIYGSIKVCSQVRRVSLLLLSDLSCFWYSRVQFLGCSCCQIPSSAYGWYIRMLGCCIAVKAASFYKMTVTLSKSLHLNNPALMPADPSDRNYLNTVIARLFPGHRAVYNYSSFGDQHALTWECSISLSGGEIGFGQGSSRASAGEAAAQSAIDDHLAPRYMQQYPKAFRR